MTTIELPVAFEAIVECPNCEDTVTITIGLHGRLTADDDGSGSLRVRLEQRAVEHVCAQTRLDQRIPIEPRSITITKDGKSATIDESTLGRLEELAQGEIS
jgi:hypothetical protein